MDSRARRFLVSCLVVLVSSVLFAEEIPNWTVPPYRGTGAAGGLSTMTDISPGVAFVAMQPCRVFDTRNANGPYGGPRLVANTTRNFDVDSGPCTGIPTGVDAYSMNFGAILPDGIGFVTIWPTGVTRPTVSSINTIPDYVLANAAVVPAGTNGSISVFPNTGMHLYGDVNGYFSDALGNNQFEVRSGGGTAIFGENTGSGYGVWGTSAAGYGVVGGGGAGGVWATTSGSGSGVYGQNTGSGYGVYGKSTSGFGVVAETGGAGPNAAVYATNTSTNNGATGVYGQVTANLGSGVLGFSKYASGVTGVSGQTGSSSSAGVGVRGIHVDINGVETATGYLGLFGGWGVYSDGNAHVSGTFTATNNKGFVQPHPLDASKEIRYISLEGPHTEVYFRGTAQISQGVTRVPIPQHFQFVADPATYSTLVTAVGAMATVAVVSEGPEGIVVQASRNVKIHYVVYAEREAVRNPDPIIENVHFRPDPERDVLAHLPDTFRQLMIQNGTLNSDGKVNMETARRLGWDKEWEKRGKPVAQSPPD
jgi:hypothetical protein